MMNMSNLLCYQKLLEQANHNLLLKNFIELNFVKMRLLDYRKNPTQQKSDELLKLLETYYLYASLLGYASKALKYKGTRTRKLEKERSKKLMYNFDFESLQVNNKCISRHHTWSEVIESVELLTAINVLSQKQQQVLKAIYIGDLSQKQIAGLLKITPQSISKTHKAGINKLKKKLNEDK